MRRHFWTLARARVIGYVEQSGAHGVVFTNPYVSLRVTSANTAHGELVDVSTARLSPAQRDLLANACFARRAVTLSVRQDLLTAPWHGNVVEQVHAESVVVDASAPAE